MCSEFAVNARALSKCYAVYQRPRDRLWQMFSRRRKLYSEFWALKDVDLCIVPGEAVGLIGCNGAGKSTLLQLVCGTLTPTSGVLETSGRVAALLELGAGFNPEFSGRENVFFSAAVLGLEQEEIEARFEAIVEFSGIKAFIDQPVKTYSSGMFVRLAFAVATSVDPDILVVDEALSVGDGDFARKSFDRIMSMKEAGKTVLFCSHSMFMVESICGRVLWLDKGLIAEQGDPARVIASYQRFLDGMESSGMSAVGGAPVSHSGPKGRARFTAVRVSADGETGKSLRVHSRRSTVSVEVDFVGDPALPAPSVGVTFSGVGNRIVASAGAWNDSVEMHRAPDGSGSTTVVFPRFALLKGQYGVGVFLFCERGLHVYEAADPVATLEVVQEGVEQGVVYLEREWRV